MALPKPLYALVVDQELRKTKQGDRFFWQVTFKTTVGVFRAFQWNAPSDAETSPLFPHKGDVIEVTSFQDQIEDRGTIVIDSFSRLTRDELPESAKSILDFDKASQQELDEALNLIGDSTFWDMPMHHRFTLNCMAKLDKEKLRDCPAATHVHHQFSGGLLVHTAEVLGLCRAIVEASPRYSFINRDVLYASAILHDMGKVQTYLINDLGVAESLTTEKSIGHLFYSMHLVQTQPKGTVSQEFVDEVLHCIASHHGLPDWGSLKVVQSIEAGILSRVDYISSRNGMVEKVLQDAIASKQPLQNEFKIYSDPYFASTGMKEYVERN